MLSDSDSGVSCLHLACLLPTFDAAWSDGVIQGHERALILSLTEGSGVSLDDRAVAKVVGWLETPPTADDKVQIAAALRDADLGVVAADDWVTDWARALIRAEVGILGLGGLVGEGRHDRGADPDATLSLLRDLALQRIDADTVHKQLVPPQSHSMWPQPSPWGPGLPPAVLGVPQTEYFEYMATVVQRYFTSLSVEWWEVLQWSTTTTLAPMDDATLARIFFSAPFSRLLSPLDPADRVLFADALADARPGTTLYKIDQHNLERAEALPGIELPGTVGLFALDGDGLVPLAIAVRDRVFRPVDGESWARARYFLIECCSVAIVLGAHPALHFPMDSVIGVTREVVPKDHPIARLIEAHGWLQLPLNHGVMFNAKSVAHNHQNEIYTPFPIRRDDVFEGLVPDHYAGIEGNSAFPAYRYPMAAPVFPGPYCAFLRRYYDVVLAFCAEVAAAVAPGDPVVAAWGAALHDTLPGFPSAEDLKQPDVLARALAGFVFTVAVWHSTEHHTFGEWPVNLIPQRLRVPVPVGDDAPIPTSEWTRPVDLARQEMARRMFYEAHTVRSILEADYRFGDAGLEEAAARFREALRACDRDQPVRLIPLERIACSLQF